MHERDLGIVHAFVCPKCGARICEHKYEDKATYENMKKRW